MKAARLQWELLVDRCLLMVGDLHLISGHGRSSDRSKLRCGSPQGHLYKLACESDVSDCIALRCRAYACFPGQLCMSGSDGPRLLTLW